MKEVWKSIPGFEGSYEVSNLGRVRSLDRVQTYRDGRVYHYKGKIRKMHKHDRTGHPQISLGGIPRKVHTLVLTAFVGPRPPGLEARHRDGDETNNRLNNLEWATRSDNTKDRKWHKGPDGYRKLTGEQASNIKKRLRGGAPRLQLAEEFGVSRNTIRAIAVGEIHVDA